MPRRATRRTLDLTTVDVEGLGLGDPQLAEEAMVDLVDEYDEDAVWRDFLLGTGRTGTGTVAGGRRAGGGHAAMSRVRDGAGRRNDDADAEWDLGLNDDDDSDDSDADFHVVLEELLASDDEDVLDNDEIARRMALRRQQKEKERARNGRRGARKEADSSDDGDD